MQNTSVRIFVESALPGASRGPAYFPTADTYLPLEKAGNKEKACKRGHVANIITFTQLAYLLTN